MPRSIHGGRHELGQNFLIHRPTIARIITLVRQTEGTILEIGAGDGALTAPLSRLDRPLTALELDEHRIRRLRQRARSATIKHADALRTRIDASVVVGNLPFHLTTPLLRRLLAANTWSEAIVLTQWEVARKRAGIGPSTMMSAQSAPWFTFQLHSKVPAHGFRPRPSVDGGILQITRRQGPLVPRAERIPYGRFVGAVFTGPGRSLDAILRQAAPGSSKALAKTMHAIGLSRHHMPRDLSPEQWAELWRTVRASAGWSSARTG